MKRKTDSGAYWKEGKTPTGKRYVAYRHPEGDSRITIVHGKDPLGYLITHTKDKETTKKRSAFGMKAVKYESKRNPTTGQILSSKPLLSKKKK